MLIYIAPIILTIKKRTVSAIIAWVIAAIWFALTVLSISIIQEETFSELTWWDGWLIFLFSLIIPKKKSSIVINNYYVPHDDGRETFELDISDTPAVENRVVNHSISPVEFYVVLNGKKEGPFYVAELIKMINAGQITSTTPVWKKGLTEWEKAEDDDELQGFFSDREIVHSKINQGDGSLIDFQSGNRPLD